MAAGASAYLVVKRDDGFGDVFPLAGGEHYTLGRAPTNRIVLKDDMCSREHAEVRRADGRWRLRDLNSLNGTRVNGEKLDSEWELAPHDEVHLGRTHLLFVEDMAQLPNLPVTDRSSEGMSIKKRLGQTRYLTPIPADSPSVELTPSTVGDRHSLSRDLSLLYRLALDRLISVGDPT